MYLIDRENLLTPELLQKYINNFVLNRQPQMQKWQRYYEGKHDILQKTYSDSSKPCNRIVTNFCSVIANTYNGYVVGKPVSYSSNNDISQIQEILNYNDCVTADSEWLKSVLINGVGYELQYLDEDAKQRFCTVDSANSFAIYSNDLGRSMLYFVRMYPDDELENNGKYYCEVYDSKKISTYTMQNQLGTLQLVIETPHYFGQVPVSVFQLNTEETSIFDNVITLNDAYNKLQSAEVDDYEAFVDAYLVLIGMDADDEEINKMREDRVLIVPEKKPEYLTKNGNDTQIQNMLMNLQKNIFKVSSCPDMSDESFMAQSGVGIQYKLTGFENSASNIVANFTKAIQRRIELIVGILNLKGGDAAWRDIQINFTRNLPNNITDTVQLINSCQGIVSNKTLLSLLPFIKDVDAEIEAVVKQKQENMDMFGLGTDNHTHTVEDDEDE